MKPFIMTALLFSSGCSTFMTPPSAPSYVIGENNEVHCTDSVVAPIADTAAAIGLAAATVAMLASPCSGCFTSSQDSSQFVQPTQNQSQLTAQGTMLVTSAVVTGIGSIVYGVSAAHGYHVSSKCIDIKAAQMETARTEAIKQEFRKQAEAAERAEKVRLQKQAEERAELSRKEAERSRKEAEEQRLLVEQQQIHQDTQFSVCVEALGEEDCSVPAKFAAFKSQRERQTALEEERQLQVQKEVAQDDAQKNLKNCNDFIKYRCTPITTSTTTKECGWRDGKFSCWNEVQHSETGKYTCKESPPTGCTVPGVNDNITPQSENEQSSQPLPTILSGERQPPKQNTTHLLCCDGTRSPGCTPTSGGPSGCCSSHKGVCDNR